jgi:hypothetical protein
MAPRTLAKHVAGAPPDVFQVIHENALLQSDLCKRCSEELLRIACEGFDMLKLAFASERRPKFIWTNSSYLESSTILLLSLYDSQTRQTRFSV